VLPWFIVASSNLRGLRSVWILLLHLLTCWVGWLGFRQQTPSFLLAGLAVLALNGVGYALVRRSYQLSTRVSLR
jgi:hypothetical protein